MANNNIPASVDYTSRDFYALRDDLVTRVKTRVNANGKRWLANDPADFGFAMVEAFAYVGDISNYYIDRAANESFIETATKRESLLNIASLYGYSPMGFRQSSVLVTFTNEDTVNNKTIPAGTEFTVYITSDQSTSSLVFTLNEEVTVVAAEDAETPGTAQAYLTHGSNVAMLQENAKDVSDNTDIAGELVGYSNGLSEQKFQLLHNPIVDGSLEVYVKSGNSYALWNKVDHIADYGPTDAVYQVSYDAENFGYITFGDNVSGAIPTIGAAIKVTYVVGGGLVGNIDAGQIFTLSNVPVSSGIELSSISSVRVTSDSLSPATGGEDAESNDSIRANIPTSIRTMNRAVTLKDFKDLAISIPGVGKALAAAAVPTAVSLYVSGTVSDSSTDYYPGFDSSNSTLTTDWYSLRDSVLDYFSDKTQIGTTLTILPPSYIDVQTEVEYLKQPQYTHGQIVSALRYGVVAGFGYNYLDYGQVIYPEQVENSLMSTVGVSSLKVRKLYRDGESVARTNLIPTNGELFVFRDNNTRVYPVASLTSLTSSAGTIEPGFQSHVFDYNITGVATSTITLTPTVWNSTCTISYSVNGVYVNTVTSGSATGSISTPSGTTTIEITVTGAAEDGGHTNTYTLVVTR